MNATADNITAAAHDDPDVREGRQLYVEMRTPEGSVYSGIASSVVVPGAKGSMGVLPKHAPLMSSLDVGFTRIRDPLGVEWKFVTGLGFVEIFQNVVLLLVDFADDVKDIDVSRAEASRDRALERMRANGPDFDRARAEGAVQRASTRLRHAHTTG